MPVEPDLRRRRIRLRAWRRGFREIDLILGGFADKAIDQLDDKALDAFEALLNLNDQDVYEWLIGRSAPPAPFAALIARIRAISDPLTPRS
jgi:antitoxin CptB